MTTDVKSDWEVRRAASSEVNILVAMRLRLEDHMARANPRLLPLSARGRAALPDKYRQWLADASTCVLVAECRSTATLVGMAVGRAEVNEDLVPSSLGRIDDVWVELSFRRQGVCRELLKRLLEYFEQRGVQVIDLHYAVGNVEAEHAWHGLGFRPVLTVASVELGDGIRQLERGPRNGSLQRGTQNISKTVVR